MESHRSFLKFPWVIDSLVKVHRGFNNMVFGGDRYRKIADALEMARRENPNYQVAFTGHSLGAACSILAGAYTAWSMPDCQILMVNFGAPRVANTSFKSWVEDLENASLWRFVYDDDIIARLPPAFAGYRHVGHLFHLEKSQARAYYRFKGDDDLDLVGAPEWKWNIIPSSFDFVEFCTDHRCSNYPDYLERKSKKNPIVYYASKFEDDHREKVQRFWNFVFPSPNELRELGIV